VPAISSKAMVEEIEDVLVSIAAHTHKSSESLRKLAAGCKNRPITALCQIFNRLQPREMKWLIRLLLKNTGRVTVPADFGVCSYQSQLPNCVSVHIEIPESTPTGLQLGRTGMIRAESSHKRSISTLTKSPNDEHAKGSLHTSFQSDRGRQGRRGDLRNMKRDISRPNSPSNIDPKQVPSPSVSTLIIPHCIPPIGDTSHLRSRKRRRTARNMSPSAHVFQRGVLQPLQTTSSTSNRLPEINSASSQSQMLAAGSAGVTYGDENTPETAFPFRDGSSQNMLTTVSTNHIPITPRSTKSERGDDNLPICNFEPPKVDTAKNNLLSQDNLLQKKRLIAATNPLRTPPSSDANLSSPVQLRRASIHNPRKSWQKLQDTLFRKCEDEKTSDMMVSLSESARFTSAMVTVSTVRSSKHAHTTVLSSTTTGNRRPSLTEDFSRRTRAHPLSSLKASSAGSPLKKAGKGPCALSTAICPLINCIFLLPPTLPSVAKDRLITALFPLHACSYLTSINDLAHTSLPRRCLITGRKFRKIVLIESHEIEESKRTLKQVDGLKLTRSRNRKVWVECYDWRLIDAIAKRESEIEGSGVNLWKRYWICAV
jgi:hypothetical protein